MSVSMTPGETLLTRIPSAATSLDRARAKVGRSVVDDHAVPRLRRASRPCHTVTELVRLVLLAAAVLLGTGLAAQSASRVAWAWAPSPVDQDRARGAILTCAQARAAQGSRARRELPAPQVQLHLHGPVSAEDLAAIIRQHTATPIEDNRYPS
jgi:hypothetical protein